MIDPKIMYLIEKATENPLFDCKHLGVKQGEYYMG